MARENQGLQIALIIFVMLTFILGVTTFLFQKNYMEEKERADQETQTAQSERGKAANILQDNNDLKRMIGAAQTEDLKAIDDQFQKDTLKYGANFSEEERDYRKLLAYLWQTIQDKNTELDGNKVEIQKLKDDYAAREASMRPQIVQFKQAADRAAQDLASVQDKARSERTRITGDQTEVAAKLKKARQDATAALSKLEARLTETTGQMAQLVKVNQQKSQKLQAIQKETFEVPDGQVTWVSQRNGTVSIDLGRADALTPLVSFSVYPADTTDLSGGGKKASIEVTQITGEHSAECRVLEDSIRDPIMPGDKIHTPVWTPGERRRFALAGFMDIDGDGRSDQPLVRNVITMNGGIIDCETDPSGKRRGKITIDTRYLVLGKAPDAKSAAGVLADYTRMMDDAKRYGIQKIAVGQLLQQMGWRDRSGVVTYGRGSNPNDFRAGADDGGFRQRQPPGTSTGRGSLY